MSTIYIASDYGTLKKQQQTLVFNSSDDSATTIFPYKTEQLVILGKIELTHAALRLLMRYNIDTIFLGTNGRYNGKLAFQESKNVFLRKKQYDLLSDDPFRIKIAKAIVNSKLKNQLAFLQRILRNREAPEEVSTGAEKMKRIIDKSGNAESLSSLRGYEGSGARTYFSVFRHNIIQDWAEFNGRSMHPPQDTVNAVLSFLYTLLFFRIDSVLEIEGLDSYVGYFHELGYGKRALTYDLMEEYRTPVADTLCCSLFNRGTLTEEDFRTEVFSTNDAELPLETADSEENDETPAYEEKKGVLLTKKGLQKVIPHFEKKLETEIFYHPLGSHIPYKRVFREQVRHFKRVINGDEESYKPLVIK